MQIQRVSIKQINPAPYNPRVDLKPGEPAYEKLKRSIDEFGCVEPLVWNRRTGNLVGGHQRFKVLIERGLTEVDVSVVDLPPEKEKALNVALNKIQGDWDQQKLAELLEELTKTPDFDVESTGFDLPDIKELIAEVLHQSPEDEDFDPEDPWIENDRRSPTPVIATSCDGLSPLERAKYAVEFARRTEEYIDSGLPDADAVSKL